MPTTDTVTKRVVAVLFADVAGYSKLSEPQLRRFFLRLLPDLADCVSRHTPLMRNSWGDAIVAAFDDAAAAARAALAVRELFQNANWTALEVPPLRIRISLHSGPLYFGPDPFTGRDGIVGTQVNLAARIEPITIPNHVWATDNFISILDQSEGKDGIAWDPLGERPLAKEWGAKTLYRVRWAREGSDLPLLTDLNDGAPAAAPDGFALSLKMLDMGTQAQKFAALEILGRIDRPESVAALLATVRRPSSVGELRDRAFASLRELRNASCVPELLDALRVSDDPDFVSETIVTMEQLRDARSVDPLLAIVANTGPDTRFTSHQRGQAIMALAAMHDHRATAALRTILETAGDANLDIAAATAYRTKDPSLVPPLVAIASHREAPLAVRNAALQSGSLLGPGADVEPQAAVLAKDQHEPSKIRRSALMMLGLIKTERARGVLAEVAGRLDDPLSAEALRMMYKADEATDRLRKALDEP